MEQKRRLANILEDAAVILIAPDQYLGDAAQCFDEQVFVVLGDRLILVEDSEQVSTMCKMYI